MAIARFPVVVLDCPDPHTLAEFYGAMLGWDIVQNDEDMCFIRAEYGDSLGFHRVRPYTAPQWPEQVVPQQMHIDVVVDDLDEADAELLKGGAAQARCHQARPPARDHVSGLARSGRASVLPLLQLKRVRRVGKPA